MGGVRGYSFSVVLPSNATESIELAGEFVIEQNERLDELLEKGVPIEYIRIWSIVSNFRHKSAHCVTHRSLTKFYGTLTRAYPWVW